MPQGEQNNSISLPVLPGMRQDLEPHTAPPGTITVARNVRFPAGGSVQSRRGLAVLASGTPSTAVSYANMLGANGPDFLHPCPGGFLFGAQGFGFRYSDAGAAVASGSYSVAQPRGIFETITREELTPANSTTRAPWPLSAAVNAGMVAVCHSPGNGQPVMPAYGVNAGPQTDPVAGTVGSVVRVFTEAGTMLSSGYWDDMSSALVVADGNTTGLYIIYQNGTDVRIRSISANGAVGSSSSIGTLSTAQCYFAACTWPGVGVALVFQSAANSLLLMKLVNAAPSGSIGLAVTAGNGVPVSCYADTSYAYVGFALRAGASYDSKYAAFTPALGSPTSAGTLYALGSANAYLGPPLFGPTPTAGVVLALVAHDEAATATTATRFTRPYELTVSGGTVVTGYDQMLTLPLSSPFANGLWWAHITTGRGSAGEYQYERAALLDFQDMRAVSSSLTTAEKLRFARIALLGDQFYSGEDLNYNTPHNIYLQHVYHPAQLTSGEWVMGIPRIVRRENVYNDVSYLLLCEWLKIATGTAQQTATVRNEVMVTGQLTSASYTLGSYAYANGGATYALQSQGLEVGIVMPPGIWGASSATAGGLVAGSTYQYRAELELIDEWGRRHRSAPSSIQSVTVGVGNSATVLHLSFWPGWLRSFSLSPSVSRMVVHVYRSVAGGANFQRCTPAQGAPVFSTTGTIDYTDTLSDALLAGREFLYTDGGVLANDAPPSCRFISATEDRVWLAGLWDTSVAQSSKILVPGEPAQFSDSEAFKVTIAEPITGLAAQDGLLIIFAVSAIYVVQGLGPNDQGQGNWDTPRCVTRSTGCIDWRSIVATSIGIFYQSERGVMLLPRGAGEPQFIGAPIQDLLETFGRTITSAACCITSDAASVRFCTGSGTIIYDLETQAWSYDIPPASPAGIIHTKVCDTDAGPTYARKAIASAIGFDQEQDGLTADTFAPVASYLEWAPLHPQALAGWTAFTGAITVFGKLSGAAYPSSSLTVTCNVDADTANTKTKASMTDMADPDYRRLQLKNKRQGCSATLSITTAAAPWRFIGWTVELETLEGTRNVPTAQVY